MLTYRPFIDKAVSASIVANIEPMLKDMKPGWITSIRFARYALMHLLVCSLLRNQDLHGVGSVVDENTCL